jgi:hypothetical protein
MSGAVRRGLCGDLTELYAEEYKAAVADNEEAEAEEAHLLNPKDTDGSAV